jgi:hypothetical protein
MASERRGWGRVNAGQSWGVIATDVDRAFAHCRMTTYERMLWQYVREHSWGISARRGAPRGLWPDAIPCPLNLYALARDWGVDRRRLVEAKGSLIEDRIFMDVDGLILINKDASTWPDSRLSPQGRAYAMDAWPKRVSEQTSPNEGGNPPRGEGGNPPRGEGGNPPRGEGGNPPRGRAEIRPGGGRKSAQGEGGNPPRVHIEEHARVLDSPRVEIPEDTSSMCVKTPEPDTHTPGPDLGSTPQRPEPDYADVRLAASILASDLRTTHLGTELLRQHNLPGMLALEGWRWVLAANAILGPGIEDRKRRSFAYLAAIARGFDAADRERASAPATNGHVPARPESAADRKRRELHESLQAFKAELLKEGPTDAG